MFYFYFGIDYRRENVISAASGKVEYVEVDVPGAGWP